MVILVNIMLSAQDQVMYETTVVLLTRCLCGAWNTAQID
jgi:hypothetical protein